MGKLQAISCIAEADRSVSEQKLWQSHRSAQSAGGRNKGSATGHRKMPVQFAGCNHVQVATLSKYGASTQELLHVGPHHCGDAACKIPSQGHFNRGLQNIESAMDGTLAIRGKSMFWVSHKQTKTKWDLVRAGPTEKN